MTTSVTASLRSGLPRNCAGVFAFACATRVSFDNIQRRTASTQDCRWSGAKSASVNSSLRRAATACFQRSRKRRTGLAIAASSLLLPPPVTRTSETAWTSSSVYIPEASQVVHEVGVGGGGQLGEPVVRLERGEDVVRVVHEVQ